MGIVKFRIKLPQIKRIKFAWIILKQISKSYGFVEVGGKYFGSFFIDDEGACAGFGGVVDITKAIVTYKDGTKPEDIIKTKKLIIDNFEPVKINIGSK